MGRIRQMDEHLATLIAAGEVVTGPVSVVRELVDNALDAGATAIDVAIEEGGLQLVRVADNGSGMDADDARLCLSRHATSKLAEPDDLFRIRTLGFRGEALAAIVAVSQLKLETQRPEDAVGTSVRAAAGAVSGVRPAARRPGTTVEVSALFYNTPARREFQDGARAEAARVVQAVQRLAIARPEIRFTLRDGEREVFNLPATDDLRERIRQVYDADFADALIPVFAQRGEVVVSGFVAHPAAAVRRPRRNTFIVNGRPFESFEVRRLLTTTFAPMLGHGEHVEAVLIVDLPPAEVDVNVSPDKSQVRFRRTGQVLGAVSDALRSALERRESVASLSAEPIPAALHPAPREPEPPREGGPDVARRVAALRRFEEEEGGRKDSWELMFGRERAASPAPPPAGAPAADEGALVPREWPAPAPTPVVRETPRHGLPRQPAAILQVSNAFLVCAGEGGMWIVDQHSAHERVHYERLRERWLRDRRNPDVQPLMFPEAVRLDAARFALLEEMTPYLERMGFELTPAGAREVLVQAVPSGLSERSPRHALEELLEAYVSARAAGLAEGEAAAGLSPLEERLLKTMACHAAVKAGQPLSEPEIRTLWRDLVEVDLAVHDVHGRPGVVFLPTTEVARRLGR